MTERLRQEQSSSKDGVSPAGKSAPACLGHHSLTAIYFWYSKTVSNWVSTSHDEGCIP